MPTTADASQRPTFTLWQLLVTVTVIAVVLAISIPLVQWLGDQDALTSVVVQAVLYAVLTGLIMGLGIAVLFFESTGRATVFHILVRSIGSLGGLGMMITMVPEFQTVYFLGDVGLPGVAVLLLDSSHLALRYWFYLAPLVALMIMVDGWLFHLLHREKSTRRWAKLGSGIITALLVSGIVTAIVSLMYPLTVPP